MPRIRTIKPEFWDSPDTAKAGLRTRLLYIAMWNWADDYGIGDATPGRIINFAFPHDDVPVADYPRNFADVSDSFGVVFFSFAGRPYYVIPAWDEHQRTEKRAKPKAGLVDAAQEAISAARSTVAESPRIVADSPTIFADRQSLEREQGNRGTGEREQGKGVTAQKRGTMLDPEWMPTQSTIDGIKAECPRVDIKTEHRKFVDYWTAKTGRDATKLDWDATWRNWMRNARPTQSSTGSVVDDKVAGWLALATDNNPMEITA
jgi:hypothetical protein